MGTKPTQQIIDELKAHSITIKHVERASTGLKGASMKKLIDLYPAGAKGILLDDQLKQVNDVHHTRELAKANLSKKNQTLKAYDINSGADLTEFAKDILLTETHNFHPKNIVKNLLTPGEIESRLKKHLTSEADRVKQQLRDLDAKLNNREFQQKFPQESANISRLVAELCVRFFEADTRSYDPEVVWVSKVTTQLTFLVEKLISNQPITYNDLEQARETIFHQSPLDEVVPNSRHDELIKNFLQEMIKFPLVDDLLKICHEFANNLTDDTDANESPKAAISELIVTLSKNKASHSYNLALTEFAAKFQEKKQIFAQTATGREFILSIVEKIPLIGKILSQLIGEFCKTNQQEITTQIGNATLFYKNKIAALNTHSPKPDEPLEPEASSPSPQRPS